MTTVCEGEGLQYTTLTVLLNITTVQLGLRRLLLIASKNLLHIISKDTFICIVLYRIQIVKALLQR